MLLFFLLPVTYLTMVPRNRNILTPMTLAPQQAQFGIPTISIWTASPAETPRAAAAAPLIPLTLTIQSLTIIPKIRSLTIIDLVEAIGNQITHLVNEAPSDPKCSRAVQIIEQRKQRHQIASERLRKSYQNQNKELKSDSQVKSLIEIWCHHHQKIINIKELHCNWIPKIEAHVNVYIE